MVEQEAPIYKCMLFTFEIPQTKKIAFHKLVRTQDATSVDCLTKATQSRDGILIINIIINKFEI